LVAITDGLIFLINTKQHEKTMRHTLLTIFIGLSLAACGDQAAVQNGAPSLVAADTVTESIQQSPSEKLNQWFEHEYETELMMSPLSLTFLGRKDRYDEIDDMSEAAEIKQLEWKKNSVLEMKDNFDYEQLTDAAKLSYDLWEYQYDQAMKGAEFMRSGYVFNQMNGVHTYLPTIMLSFHTVESLSDMQAYVSRLGELGRAINQLIERAQLAAAEGVRPPRFAYEVVRDEAVAIITGKPFTESEIDSSILADVRVKIASLKESELITEQQADELLALAETALIEKFAPSYKNLIAFLDADIDNTSEQSQGVHANPNGDAYYVYRLNSMTTTDLTAEQIHQLGLTEVKRLRAEMESLKIESGFKGDLQEFFSYIRDSQDNQKFYYPNTDEGRKGYIDDATAAIDNIKKELPNYFGILPKGDLIVKRVESFREQDGAPQHYYPGTPDGSRPGVYYAHLSDMSTMPKNELEVIAYHEGLPGHHMQIAIAQELTGIPTFRTQARFTAYSEGWALYSEKLAKEMPNTFTDLHSDFGRLGSEIWRAIRLVVDSGMHSKKWSEQQAIDFFSANSPAPLETIRTEIRRYMVLPGQATSYKVGMIDIQRLRKKSETELGDKFDIKAFHDTILGGGALPLSMLDRKVSSWIASQK
jgi:uncharacterized protein (DUF885 family)